MGSVRQKIEIELDVPEGYEATGEYRPAKKGECFLSRDGLAGPCIAQHDFGRMEFAFILRKVKRYREPVLPADLDKVCEFSDNETGWFTGTLIGVFSTDYGIRWKCTNGLHQRCRIEVTDD